MNNKLIITYLADGAVKTVHATALSSLGDNRMELQGVREEHGGSYCIDMENLLGVKSEALESASLEAYHKATRDRDIATASNFKAIINKQKGK